MASRLGVDRDRYRREKAARQAAGKPTLPATSKTARRPAGRRLPRAPEGGVYEIRDVAKFRDVIVEAVKNRFDGICLQASTSVGIGNSTLKRCLDGRMESVRHHTFERLRTLVGQARVARLEATVLSPDVQLILKTYDSWIAERGLPGHLGTRLGKRILTGEVSTLDPLKGQVAMATGFDELIRLDHEVAAYQQRFPDVWAPLKKLLRKRGHLSPRARIAFRRVVAPLLDWRYCSEVELQPDELTPNDLRAFLAAGVRRECIMLERETDIRRAQQIAERWRDEGGPRLV